MSQAARLQRKIDDLSGLLKSRKEAISRKEKCIPTMLIAGVITPIVIWILLYFIQPRFVQSKEGAKYVRSNTKVFYWTLLITVIIWVGMYLWTWCKGYGNISMLCARK